LTKKNIEALIRGYEEVKQWIKLIR
jgi:hypothetical protein